jgi:branched-chain amino acid transport system ATP-binding protein
MTHAITLAGVRKNFGPTEIIRGVDLDIERDKVHAIIGPNGAGKSTLYNLISGRHPVSAGTICLNGEDITNRKPYEVVRRGLARSFQVTNVFHRMSVFENIRCAMMWSAGYRYSFWTLINRERSLSDRIDEIMEQTGLASRRAVPAGLLAYSDQRALEIAITLATGADVILLDEPTAGMSRSETAQAVQLISRLAENKTMVIVEHDMGVVFDLAATISVLVYGQIIASGTPSDIRADAEVRAAYLGTEADPS